TQCQHSRRRLCRRLTPASQHEADKRARRPAVLQPSPAIPRDNEGTDAEIPPLPFTSIPDRTQLPTIKSRQLRCQEFSSCKCAHRSISFSFRTAESSSRFARATSPCLSAPSH